MVGVLVGVLLVGVIWGCDCHQKPYSYQYVRREIERVFAEEEANRWLCFVFGICAIDAAYPLKPDLAIVYQWSQLEFDYPSIEDRQADIDAGNFIPGKPAPIDVDVHYSYSPHKKSRVFVAIPRFQDGVPIALGVVTDKKFNSSNVITPYPSWDWHKTPSKCNENRIVSVYRVSIDECQRLWVLDTGRLKETQVCPPQILAFDLQTDQLIHRFQLPKGIVEPRSILVTPVVDVRDAHAKCKDTFIYIADCQTYSVIVYDVQKGVIWKATDKTMYPYPNYGTFDILGDSFDLMDGVLGMSLSPYKPGQDRILYYHAMSSPTENWVLTSDLRNRSRFIHDSQSSPEIFHTYHGKRHTQSAAEAIDKDGVMYFGLMSDVTLNCWNTHTEYGPKTIDIIAKNLQTLQFASGVKVITNSKAGQELWVLTSRFQKVATDSLSTSDVNFRILAGRTEDMVAGTACRGGIPPGPPGGGYGLVKPPFVPEAHHKKPHLGF
ncbi:yellow-e3 precursor [Tribolium castaneum]|uniref:Yellow-d n=1 Tax=Tribolium castaneum TaxID=7070 RepID=D1LZK3_TRICA|nr:yellow-e3 precursor [Tribolium castaneum]ACY71057.1 yellow-d [Tribolium castaneum]|eukprot:NP_001161913.1 yellow-e3 precursor [Tribolium castaneum]